MLLFHLLLPWPNVGRTYWYFDIFASWYFCYLLYAAICPHFSGYSHLLNHKLTNNVNAPRKLWSPSSLASMVLKESWCHLTSTRWLKHPTSHALWDTAQVALLHLLCQTGDYLLRETFPKAENFTSRGLKGQNSKGLNIPQLWLRPPAELSPSLGKAHKINGLTDAQEETRSIHIPLEDRLWFG